MKKWTYVLSVVAVLAFGMSNTGRCVQNPGIRNPADVATVPPSSLNEGLVTSPSPFSRTGNDAMTGNVRGARSFRGGLPYRSSTSFWGGSSSTMETANLVQVGGPLTRANTLLGPTPDAATLDSFLRNSAGWEDFGTYSGKYVAPQYYSRKNTVPTTTPGRSGVFNPTQSRVGTHAPDVFGLEALDAKKNALLEQQAPTSASAKPLTPQEIALLTSGQTRVRPMNEPLAAEQYRKQMEQIRLELMNLKSQKAVSQPDTAEDTEKQDLLDLLPQPGGKRTGQDAERAEIQNLATPYDRTKSLDAQAKLLSEMQKTAKEDTKGLESDQLSKEALKKLLSSYMQEEPGAIPKTEKGATAIASNLEKLAEQIASLKSKDNAVSVAEPLQVGVKETGADSTVVPGTGLDSSQLPGTELPSITPESYKQLLPDTTQEQGDKITLVEVDKLKNLSDQEVAVRAKKIMGKHKTHESFMKARFEQHMAEAQNYLKQGKYYQASNAFAQATIYDSKKPAAMAGRGLALFGAGEYMSSALFLSRAIEMSDQYARSKVDLAATMGDMDKLETRIADAEEWLERSCAPELEFVLAYVYYHSGRLEPAKRAIESAQKEMPNSKAIKTLKEVIDAAPKPPKEK